MRLYKVKVYNIGHGKDTDKLTYIDDIIVSKIFGDVEEVVTKNVIRTKTKQQLNNLRHCESTYIYAFYGYDLIVVKDDLNTENIVSEREIKKYIDNFENSKINQIFDEMYNKNKKVRKIKR